MGSRKGAPEGAAKKRIMKKNIFVNNGRVFRAVFVIGTAAACGVSCAMADAADAATSTVAASSGIVSAVETFTQNHPWVSTVLLAIGGLRVLFKPVMSLLDSYIKSNCSTEEYTKLQNFESGSIYKWLSYGLDFIGSIKLSVIGVKPATTTSEAKN